MSTRYAPNASADRIVPSPRLRVVERRSLTDVLLLVVPSSDGAEPRGDVRPAPPQARDAEATGPRRAESRRGPRRGPLLLPISCWSSYATEQLTRCSTLMQMSAPGPPWPSSSPLPPFSVSPPCRPISRSSPPAPFRVSLE